MKSSEPIRAGVSRAVITPPVGISMQGFAGRGPSIGVHDSLYATVLVLQDGTRRLAIVAADLIAFDERLTSAVRAEIARRTDLSGQCVALCASHTHYGPTIVYDESQLTPDLDAYLNNLVHLIAGAVQEAESRLEPVKIGISKGYCDIGVNRRERREDGVIVLGQNPNTTIDRDLGLVRLDREDGTPLAALINFAVHGVCQGSSTRTLSADFVAPMRDLVEKTTGCMTLYLQGGCGNINPIMMRPGFETARTLGTRLGAAALLAFETAVPETVSGLGIVANRLSFPAITYGSLDNAKALREQIQSELANVKRSGDRAWDGRVAWAEKRLTRVESAIQSYEDGVEPPAVEGEVMTIRCGDAVISMAPGEIFNEIGSRIKANSPCPNTFFVGYSNGSIGYVPIPEAYEEGGYEVNWACRINPESAEMLVEEALRQLIELS